MMFALNFTLFSALIKVLTVLPFMILANNLLGAALAGFNQVFSWERLKAGLFKGVLIYLSIFLFAIISCYVNDLNIDFNGSSYTLVDAIYMVIWGTILAYAKDGVLKLALLFKFETGKLDKEE